MNLRYALPVLSLLVLSPASAMVKCRMPDGRVVIGDSAPPGCAVESQYEDASPRHEEAAEVPPSSEVRAAPEAASMSDGAAIIERRKRERAEAAALERKREELRGSIQVMGTTTINDGHRQLIKGRLQNTSDTPFRNVRVCFAGTSDCETVSPTRLQPGAQAEFAFVLDRTGTIELVGEGDPEL